MQSSGANYYDLLVVIPSNVKNVEKRQSIRDSWAKYIDPGPTLQQCFRCDDY